jgi:hypothetical protein
VRGQYSNALIKTEKDAAKAWSDFGRMYFSEDMFEDGKLK